MILVLSFSPAVPQDSAYSFLLRSFITLATLSLLLIILIYYKLEIEVSPQNESFMRFRVDSDKKLRLSLNSEIPGNCFIFVVYRFHPSVVSFCCLFLTSYVRFDSLGFFLSRKRQKRKNRVILRLGIFTSIYSSINVLRVSYSLFISCFLAAT